MQNILVECLALWGERERSRRQYRSQVSVFKPAFFTEHSNTDKMKKRRKVADSVANIGESGDRDRFLGTSVAYLGLIRAPSYLADAGKARPDPDPMQALG